MCNGGEKGIQPSTANSEGITDGYDMDVYELERLKKKIRYSQDEVCELYSELKMRDRQVYDLQLTLNELNREASLKDIEVQTLKTKLFYLEVLHEKCNSKQRQVCLSKIQNGFNIK